jgi:hypothetical protein
MCLAALAGALGNLSAASAQSRAGALRLGLEGNLLAYDSTTLALPDGPGEIASSSTSLGVPAGGLGLGVAYGVGENVLLGARFLAASDSTDVERVTAEQTRVLLLPHLEYLFPGDTVRAFLSANAGYGSTSSSTQSAETSTALFMAGPGVGVRGFVSPALSLDAGLMMLLTTGTSKQGEIELAVNGHTILLSVAVSGWFGVASVATPVSTPRAAPVPEQHAPIAVDGDLLKTTFALDLPGAVGGVNVLLDGDPKFEPGRVRVTVMWLEREGRGAECERVAFEVDGQTTALEDVRTSSFEGFGSARSIQKGHLPSTALAALARPESQASLVLCGERIPILPAAKNRVGRFTTAFMARSKPSAARENAEPTPASP